MVAQQLQHAAHIETALVQRLDQPVPAHRWSVSGICSVDANQTQVRRNFGETSLQLIWTSLFQEMTEIERCSNVFAVDFFYQPYRIAGSSYIKPGVRLEDNGKSGNCGHIGDLADGFGRLIIQRIIGRTFSMHM